MPIMLKDNRYIYKDCTDEEDRVSMEEKLCKQWKTIIAHKNYLKFCSIK